MAKEKHSDKALTTLAAMGTEPAAWALTPIKWVEEERTVPGWVKCPTCEGSKCVLKDEAGNVLPRPAASPKYGEPGWTYPSPRHEYDMKASNAAGKECGSGVGNCPTCRNKKWHGHPVCRGEVKGMVTKMVGYPVWPEGHRFASRFAGCGYNCHLCAKAIMKSGRVPVNTPTGEAMWVGEDCAMKFLAVKIKREDDSVMEG